MRHSPQHLQTGACARGAARSATTFHAGSSPCQNLLFTQQFTNDDNAPHPGASLSILQSVCAKVEFCISCVHCASVTRRFVTSVKTGSKLFSLVQRRLTRRHGKRSAASSCALSAAQTRRLFPLFGVVCFCLFTTPYY